MSKLKQFSKLQQIKELRTRLAELEVAKAQGVVSGAEDALQRAQVYEYAVHAQSGKKRQKRLEKLLNSSENINIDASRVVNVYRQTDRDIERSRHLVVVKRHEVTDAKDILRTQKQKLARYLQVEQRTRKLCDRLKALKSTEDLRKD